MKAFFKQFLKTTQSISQWCKAHFIIVFPQLQNYQFYHASWWYNDFDGYYYNTIGLRYDSVFEVYRDLFDNVYMFDPNQQTYWNGNGTCFDNSGLSYGPDKQWAHDFLGNYWYWCPITNCYRYWGWYAWDFYGNRFNKSEVQPLDGTSVAARIFLLKTDGFEFSLLKTGFASLIVSSVIIINPMGDVSIIDQKLSSSETTQVSADRKEGSRLQFRNLERFQPQKAIRTQPLSKPSLQKQTRVAANQITSGFDLDSNSPSVSVSAIVNPSQYNGVDLLQDLSKCYHVQIQTVLAEKQKRGIELDESLKTGIPKVYKQLEIATRIAREKQQRFEQFNLENVSTSIDSVKRLQEMIKQTVILDKNGQPRKNLKINRSLAQVLQEYGPSAGYGIQTFVAIKNNPEAQPTKHQLTLISQELNNTPFGLSTQALEPIEAHILSRSWSTNPYKTTRAKVLSLKLPFQKFPASIIDNQENRVITPNFLEKLLDDYKKVETGLAPAIILKKFNPDYTSEKNYIIANASYDDFYLPALSESEKNYALEIRNKRVRKTKENAQNRNSPNPLKIN